MGLASILGTSRRERGGRCQTRRIGVGAKVMGLPVAAWLLNVFKWFPKSWGLPQIIQVMDDHFSIEAHGDLGIHGDPLF